MPELTPKVNSDLRDVTTVQVHPHTRFLYIHKLQGYVLEPSMVLPAYDPDALSVSDSKPEIPQISRAPQ